MYYDKSAVSIYSEDPAIESGGFIVPENPKRATLSPYLTSNVSSFGFGALGRKSGVKRIPALRIVLLVAFASLVIGGIAFTAFTFMSPGTSPPVDALMVPSNSALDKHPGLPEEFFEQVLASVFRQEDDHPAPTSNSTHRLRKRAIPEDQGCDLITHWLRRVCDANESQEAWEDECVDTQTGHEYFIAGNCPPNTNCAEHIDGDGNEVIICEPRTPPRNDNVSTKGRKVSQYGYRYITAVNAVGNTQQTKSITLQVAMNDATVSGFISDDNKSYVIAPNNELNAHARGNTYKLCKSGSPKARNGRDCNPLTTYDFRIGSIVDYSYGLTTKQRGVLFYSFLGNA